MYKHLKDRHLDVRRYRGVVVTDEVVTFPLWNLVGQMVGYQQYRPKGDKQERRNPKLGKYFTYLPKNNHVTAWGLDVLNLEDRRVYLLEGVFKACRFHNYGLNALAVLGNNPKHLSEWLRSLGYHVHAVCDGDTAGRKLGYFANTCTYLPEGMYVDDMSVDEFNQLLGEVTC